MSTTKHTRGPWKYDLYDDTTSFCGDASSPDYDFRVTHSGHITPDERQANDSLIAAAPDLLKALQLLLSYDDQQPGADVARCAIAKAIETA